MRRVRCQMRSVRCKMRGVRCKMRGVRCKMRSEVLPWVLGCQCRVVGCQRFGQITSTLDTTGPWNYYLVCTLYTQLPQQSFVYCQYAKLLLVVLVQKSLSSPQQTSVVPGSHNQDIWAGHQHCQSGRSSGMLVEEQEQQQHMRSLSDPRPQES